MNMKVKDFMSKNLIICSYNINVVNISNIMKKYNIGFIPIEKDKKIIGVITDRDIVVNMISNKINYNNNIESYINSKIISIMLNTLKNFFIFSPQHFFTNYLQIHYIFMQE